MSKGKKAFIVLFFVPLISGMLFLQTVSAESGHINNVTINAELTDESTAKVMMEYNFHIEAGAGSIPLKATLFSSTVIEEVIAQVDGTTYEIDFDMTDNIVMNGSIQLDSPVSETSDVTVNLEYVVKNAASFDGDKFDITIPVIATTWPPVEAVNDVFKGNLQLPENASITDSFPTSLIEGNNGDAKVELQVMPAMMSFGGTVGTPTIFTYQNIVDFFIVFLIIICAVIAWRISIKNSHKSKETTG